ncbi:MAG TPA: tetratricopeptide repeat protein [Myxococcota bacterium]|nr:tetratricopeptide repeat protein [Myxococcota bacterium]HRY93810.1 tetratricopeptide repeat protein [Myxococcota bacterium]HSA21611.1 tetratricopeptide repeat protein [Myxococcota bacterium]
MRAVFVLTACFVLLGGFPAAGPSARAAEPSAASKKEARKHFDDGERHFRLGRFADALAAYSRAYEVAPLPGFLFNIGQCHRMLGNHERAVFFYQGYLREKPEAKNRAAVARLIQDSQAKMAAAAEEQRRQEEERVRLEQEKLRLEQERLAVAERARKDDLRLREEAERTRQAEEAARVAAAAQERARLEAEPEVYETWWFWTVLVGGLAVAAGGVALGLTMSGDEVVLPGGSLGTLDRR